MLRHLHELVGDAPAHQPEVAGIDRDVDPRDPGEQAIEGLGRFLLEAGFAGAAAPQAVDDVGAFPRHHLVHRRQQFRRILQIGIDDQHEVAAHGGKPRRQRQLMAVVAGEPDRDDVAVFRREFVDQLPGVVGRAVIDQNQLEPLAAQRAGGGRHLAVEFAQAVFFVAAGYNDGQKHLAGARHPVLNFHGFGSLSGNEIGSNSLPAIIDEARLIVHQFLDRPGYDSSKPAAAKLIKCLGAI